MKSLVEAKRLGNCENQDKSKLPRLPVTNMSKSKKAKLVCLVFNGTSNKQTNKQTSLAFLQLTVLIKMKLLRSIILNAVIVKYCIVSLMSGGMNVLCVKNGHAWVVKEFSLQF